MDPPSSEQLVSWHNVFVYGTLKKGFTNYKWYLGPAVELGKAVFVGEGKTKDPFPMTLAPVHLLKTRPPVVLDRREGEQISGEVYEVDDSTLEGLDLLEGIKAGKYLRREIEVCVQCNRQPVPIVCHIYFFPVNPELLALPRMSNYGEREHGLYLPVTRANPDIVELCTRKRRHGLATSTPSSMQVHCLRLLPNQDLLKGLRQFCEERRISASVVLTCVGSTGRTRLRPAGVPASRDFDGKFEIVSLTGTLSDTGHHLHMSISDQECNVFGGHVLEGCIVRTTAEIAIGVLPELRFSRPADERTGFDELCIGVKRPRV